VGGSATIRGPATPGATPAPVSCTTPAPPFVSTTTSAENGPSSAGVNATSTRASPANAAANGAPAPEGVATDVTTAASATSGAVPVFSSRTRSVPVSSMATAPKSIRSGASASSARASPTTTSNPCWTVFPAVSVTSTTTSATFASRKPVSSIPTVPASDMIWSSASTETGVSSGTGWKKLWEGSSTSRSVRPNSVSPSSVER